LASSLGAAPPLAHAPTDRREHRHTAADLILAARDLGYAPRVSLEQGIEAQVAAEARGTIELSVQ
jgi:nucleoside-diphosphate-sugar epimerase